MTHLQSPNKRPIEELIAAIDRVGSPACIGIDPVFEKMPRLLKQEAEIEAIESFSFGVLEAIVGAAGVVKPQSACFERYGAEGYEILERVVAYARNLGFVVILDAKRADIGSSAQHYARGAYDMGAHFITVSPYMGPSSIEPFLDIGLGVFALAQTSNPDAHTIQGLPLVLSADSESESESEFTVAHAVGSMIAKMGHKHMGSSGLSSLGAVVGATRSPQDMESIRKVMPDQMFLVPGVGAQGGTAQDVVPLVRPNAQSSGQLGVIVNASRSVIYAPIQADESWLAAIQNAAVKFSKELSFFVHA